MQFQHSNNPIESRLSHAIDRCLSTTPLVSPPLELENITQSCETLQKQIFAMSLRELEIWTDYFYGQQICQDLMNFIDSNSPNKAAAVCEVVSCSRLLIATRYSEELSEQLIANLRVAQNERATKQMDEGYRALVVGTVELLRSYDVMVISELVDEAIVITGHNLLLLSDQDLADAAIVDQDYYRKTTAFLSIKRAIVEHRAKHR